MRQSSFLDFLCREAERFPGFQCLKNAGVVGLLEEQGRISGVRYRSQGEEHILRADLTVAADGRFSRIRKLTGVTAVDRAAPMDVCWLRLPRLNSDPHETGGFFIGGGRMLVCLPRTDEWQMGYVFPKGDFSALKAQGVPAFQQALVETAPWIGDRATSIHGWSDLHLLNVKADCLECWHRPGLLFIGDAAHVMSPVGGVGINVAIADAVETANILAAPDKPLLLEGAPSEATLARIESRRQRPTRLTQALQARIQETIVERALRGHDFELPLAVRAILATPGLRQLPMRLFALGLPRTRLKV